jgi:tyrosine-specific transport protein
VVASYLLFSNAVLISQIARGGAILSSLVPAVSHTAGVLLVAGTGASLIYCNNSSGIDRTNQMLTAVLVATFCGMLALGMPSAVWDRLLRMDWLAAPGTVPTILQVLTYGNLIPVACTYLNHDVRRIRKAVIIGSSIPTVMVALWTVMATALVPFTPGVAMADPTDTLIHGGGGTLVATVVTIFAACAVYTTIIGILMSLHEFWEEALRENADSRSNKLSPKSLRFVWYKHPGVQEVASRIAALAPATIIAVAASGEIFYKVLAFSGAYVATILFGIAPPLMVMVTRGQRPMGRRWEGPDSQQIVPGGNWTLGALSLVTVCPPLFVHTVHKSPISAARSFHHQQAELTPFLLLCVCVCVCVWLFLSAVHNFHVSASGHSQFCALDEGHLLSVAVTPTRRAGLRK